MLIPRLEIRAAEVEILIAARLLRTEERKDAGAVADAIGMLLDRVMPQLERGTLRL